VVGDAAATGELRATMRSERGGIKDFDMGPSLEEILARCEAETGLPAPVQQEPLSWAKMESAEDALRRVREQDKR
jgi:N-methylhydantoinase B